MNQSFPHIQMLYDGGYTYGGMISTSPSCMGDGPPTCHTPVSGHLDPPSVNTPIQSPIPPSSSLIQDNVIHTHKSLETVLSVESSSILQPVNDHLSSSLNTQQRRAQYIFIKNFYNVPEQRVYRLAAPFRGFSAFVRFACRARVHRVEHIRVDEYQGAPSPMPFESPRMPTPYRKVRL